MALTILAAILLIPGALQARPYYAARKSLSCAACHVSPAGGGGRWPTQDAPVRINDSIHLGADFRAIGSKSQGGHAANPSSFATPELALYVLARPGESLQLVYANNLGNTAEGYAMWSSDRYYGLPLYARAGRFRLPYGLQVDDVQQQTAAYLRALDPNGQTGFSPRSGVGFDMTNVTNDTGVEAGLNPRKGYFANLAVTNGQSNGGAAANEGKAWTARLGFIARWLALGVTGFRNHPLGVGNALEERAGLFGWTSLWRFVLLGEWGIGRDRPNDPALPRLHKRAGYAELDVDLLPEKLLFKAKYDFVNPNTVTSANARRRYTLGLEWFASPNGSLEAQWRVATEKPELKNNQGLVAAHVWF